MYIQSLVYSCTGQFTDTCGLALTYVGATVIFIYKPTLMSKGAGAAASEEVSARERERERGAENKGTHTDNFNHVHQLSFIACV